MNAVEEAFQSQRPRLLGLAYRLTGSHSDAEDVLQEAWLRIERTDTTAVQDSVGWLITVVSRLALDHLKRLERRRETYVGPWLPEPVATKEDDPAIAAELSESLTLAFLQLLDTLTPAERAAFLLADVFDVPYTDIADVLGRSGAACRQLASRARRRLSDVPPPERPVAAPDTERFISAMLSGDVETLMALLAPDVVLTSDSGPNLRAARHPVVGADRVARFITNLGKRFDGIELEPATINHGHGAIARLGGHVLGVVSADVADGKVTAIRIMLNPEKLGAVAEPPAIV